MKHIQIQDFIVGDGLPFILIAGPCVIEDDEKTLTIATRLKKMTSDMKVPFIFKASYDKANRTSYHSYRGPGLKRGIEILKHIKKNLQIPILSDVHRFEEIDPAAEVLDVMQIPHFFAVRLILLWKLQKRLP